ncbi:LexA family transcriptional regulator (plasmid) [Halodesulfovibrio aestuarii]|uniref:Helix-turn-helix n=1 Tax=Halodesulfovibrio aestuarii TaxID=126333 RepID=A0A8G2FCD2_9BACT|nr:LexA family transcriptional regulator [Halodesulfovibrio aestuarii]SHJ72655.1 Helix-turn-helix [Halodesulfovibrio aestuarii]
MSLIKQAKSVTTYNKILTYLIDAMNLQITKGISKAEIARRLGVSGATITRWLNGERSNLRLIDAIRMANFLDLTDKELMQQLSINELKILAIVSQLKESSGQDQTTYLEQIKQYTDEHGKWKDAVKLYTTHPFSIKWLESISPTHSNCFVLTVKDNLMSPTINKGDDVLVNPDHADVKPGEIFCISIKGEKILARLFPKKENIVAMFDSETADELTSSASNPDFKIVGHVSWMNRNL